MDQKGRHYDYKEIDQLVKAYQGGDSGAALKLIHAFSGFLTNIVLLVKYGIVDPHNASLRKLLSLFVKSWRERAVIRNVRRTDSEAQRLLYSVAGMVANQFSAYSEEDIWAELVAELLTLARRYRNDRGYFFHVYVTKALPYGAYRRIMKWVGDPAAIVVRSSDEYSLDHLEQYADPDAAPEEETGHAPLILADDDTELDENWINGYTCSEIFSDLTPLERRVLLMYYREGLRDREIAERFGFSTPTVRNVRASARRKLIGRRLADARKE